MWDRIKLVIRQYGDCSICIGGDFNSIRFDHERRGGSGQNNRRDMRAFEEFISDANLFDLPLHGRKYTWYRPNGRCKSRLDRFLVNNEWLDRWPNTFQKGLSRSVSDHCPVSLETKFIDWGPKPFRFVDAWTSHPNFKEFVESTWMNIGVTG